MGLGLGFQCNAVAMHAPAELEEAKSRALAVLARAFDMNTATLDRALESTGLMEFGARMSLSEFGDWLSDFTRCDATTTTSLNVSLLLLRPSLPSSPCHSAFELAP